jgi:ATP-dependent helicase HrpA
LLRDQSKVLLLQGMESRDSVLQQLIMRAFALAYELEEKLPRTRAEWQARRERGSSRVVSAALELQDLVFEILQLRQQILQGLRRSGRNREFAALQQDVEQQLQSLLYPGFMFATPIEYLRQLPRYLKGILYRLEKFPLQPTRDADLAAMLARLWEQYTLRKQYCEKQEIASEKLDSYRWMLEEFRVSLFAQQLGTRVPVSEKRLEKAWQELV